MSIYHNTNNNRNKQSNHHQKRKRYNFQVDLTIINNLFLITRKQKIPFESINSLKLLNKSKKIFDHKLLLERNLKKNTKKQLIWKIKDYLHINQSSNKLLEYHLTVIIILT